MTDRHARTRLLVGDEGLERLRNAHVAVVGLGGVGGYALEALARAGVGHLYLFDADTVESSDLNRQILATEDTLGQAKVDVARTRVFRINPEAKVEVVRDLLTPDNIEMLLCDTIAFAIDAIDSVEAKIHLIAACVRRNVAFVSCMGAGGKLDPTGFKVADISQTKGCPLARAVRQGLRQQGILHGVRCVYSEEPPKAAQPDVVEQTKGKHVNGTIAYVPAIAGLIAAGTIIHDVLQGRHSIP